MLRNYIISAFRNLLRNRVFSTLNLAGLTIGVASFSLIALYVYNELSFDRFHPKADRIYRIVADLKTENDMLYQATTSPPVGPTFLAEFPEVEDYVRVADRKVIVRLGDKAFYEEAFGWADSSIFRIFNFPMVKGDPLTALSEPNTLVLTESAAKKYFGDKDPINEVLRVGRKDLRITGIVRDIPHNSHIRFSMVGSMMTFYAEDPGMAMNDNWYLNGFYTYILLKEGEKTYESLRSKEPAYIEKYIGKVARESKMFYDDLPLQPLTSIYLETPRSFENGQRGSNSNIIILSMVGVFILSIACFNYVNLATARASRRFKEVGLRKVLGADRRILIQQFLGEAMLTSLVATVLGAVVAWLLLPFFATLVESQINFGLIPTSWLVGVFVAIALVVGLFSGLYPAIIISSLNPVLIFRGSPGSTLGKNVIRKFLVAGQFAISIILFAGMVLVFDQLNFVKNKKLGFIKEATVVLPFNFNPGIQKRLPMIKTELLKTPGVVSATASSHVPGEPTYVSYAEIEIAEAKMARTNINVIGIDDDFVPAYGIELLAGRNFVPGGAAYDTAVALVNETAARDLGYKTPGDIIGRKIVDSYPITIIGVVKDFHYRSLHTKVEPLLIVSRAGSMSKLSLKILPTGQAGTGNDIPGIIKTLEKKWATLAPEMPYRYSFLDQDYNRLYQSEEKLGEVVSVFSGLAIFVACLGLFGLTSFAVERRIKEIGIRKVLGASVTGIIMLVSKEFLLLVVAAFAIAIPATYIIVGNWLNRFAEHISIGVSAFVIAGVAVLTIAWLSVSSLSWSAARSNPVDSLRAE